MSEPNDAFEAAAKVAERDVDWTAFVRQPRHDFKGNDLNAAAWTPAPDEDHSPTHQNVRAYTHGLLVGQVIAAAIRAEGRRTQ